jgi:hypothetical protein
VCFERVVIAESRLLSITESSDDRIASHARDCGLRVWNEDTVLHVKSSNFCERVADELRYNCENLRSVHSQARTVEFGITHAVGVEIASVRITRAYSMLIWLI